MSRQKRLCYYLDETLMNKDGNYQPSVVKEGEPGHYPTNWDYGRDYELALQCVQVQNEKLGLTQTDVEHIVGSSMFMNYNEEKFNDIVESKLH